MPWIEMDWNVKQMANFFKFCPRVLPRVPQILKKFIMVQALSDKINDFSAELPQNPRDNAPSIFAATL